MIERDHCPGPTICGERDNGGVVLLVDTEGVVVAVQHPPRLGGLQDLTDGVAFLQSDEVLVSGVAFGSSEGFEDLQGGVMGDEDVDRSHVQCSLDLVVGHGFFWPPVSSVESEVFVDGFCTTEESDAGAVNGGC